MSVWGGTNFVTEAVMDISRSRPVGRMICTECGGNPDAHAARFGDQRGELAPKGCIDCKNQGWVYLSA